jgi:hypothetical protein
MKHELKDDTSVTDEETNLGDDYESEVAALAASLSSCASVKAVRFSFVQTHKIGKGMDPPSSKSFTDSSNCELAIKSVTSVDDYEKERELVRARGRRLKTPKSLEVNIRTDPSENNLRKVKNKIQASRYQNSEARIELMTKPPSVEWLEDHRRQCYPPSPVRTKRRKNDTARVWNASPEGKGSYRIVTVDDRSFEYYSPSPGYSKPKVRKQLGIMLKGNTVPLIEY